jgi:hypothetical protein
LDVGRLNLDGYMKTKTQSRKPGASPLKYSPAPANRGTVRRAYLRWRHERGMVERCDNEACWFHTHVLVWNGGPLPLILDHREGNRYDNSPSNLRLLCPNCDSQLPTRGGANRGRVRDRTDDGYVLVNRDGSRVVAATGRACGKGSAQAHTWTTNSEE